MNRWLRTQRERVRACCAGPRRITWLSTAIALGVLGFVWGVASVWYQERLLHAERARVAEPLTAYSLALTTVMNERIALLHALAAFTQTHSESTLAADFESFAGALYLNASGVRSFAAGPGGTVRYVYPLEGNELLLAHDWLTDERPAVRADVLRAIQSRRIVVSDPYELRRGGQGIVAYLAVYREEVFWGLVSITLDLPTLVAEAGLGIRRDDLNLALWDHQGTLFFGESAVRRSEPVVGRVDFREYYWEIAGVPRAGWAAAIRDRLLVFQVLTGLIGVLIVGLVYLAVNRQARLEDDVRARTAELTASEQRYRDVFATAPLAFVLWDRECRVTDWNQHAEKVFGWSRAEAVGRNFFEFLIPEAARPQVEAIAARLLKELPSHSINENLTKEGRIILCEWNNIIRYDAEGNWVGATSLGLDITARQRAESALRESEEKYRNVVERANDGIAIVQDGYIQFANLRAGVMWGSAAEELIGRPLVEFIHPDSLPEVIDRYQRRMAGEEVTPIYEVLLRDKNGRTVFAELNAGRITYQGKPADLVIVRDVTERKRAEEALRESEERYRDLVERSHALICTHDLQGNFLSVNQWALESLGYTTFPTEPVNLRDLLAPEVRDQADEYLARIQRDGAAHGLMLVQTRTGEKRIWEYHNTLRTEGVAAPIVRGIAHDITEQKRLERALRESELRWRTYIDQANDLIFALNTAGKVTLVNRAICNTLGYAAEELIGASPLRFVVPAGRAAVTAALRRILAGESITELELEAIAKDGRHILLEIRGRTLREGDKIVGTFHIARDVTERKRAERALQESNARFVALVEGIPDIVYLKDLQGRNLYVNKAYETFAGMNRADIVGRCDDEIMPSDLAACCRASDTHVLQQRGTIRSEESFTKQNGDLVCYETIKSPIFDAVGNVAGLVGVSRDISERRRAEQALAESEKRFRTLIESTPVAISIGREGKLLYANPAYVQMYGFASAAELIGSSVMDRVAPQSRAESLERSRQRDQGLPVETQYEFVGLRQDGSEFPVVATVTQVGLADGPANIGFFQDITERKRAEAARKEYSERLEQMVEARTRELRETQEQLIRQERLATLGQIAGGIAHELRSPLGAIKNAAYYLRTFLAQPSADAREMLLILDQQVDVSARIITSLLDFARPKEPVLRHVDVREIVQAVLRQADLPANIVVRAQFADDLPPLMADAEQLQIVFDNLIRNAAQAMPQGGELTISARGVQTSQTSEVFGDFGSLEITFRDTGVGIPSDALDKVFQPLYTTKAKGIGLGLALCKMIVEAHGGSIAVSSDVGKGTTFTILLPMRE